MAKILGVTPGGYYGYCNRGPSRRILDDAKLLEDIKYIFFSSRETYEGNCYDNAAMESFFHTLKLECTDDIKFATREEAMNNIFDYVQIFYNNQRIHSHLGSVAAGADPKQQTEEGETPLSIAKSYGYKK